MATLPKTNFKKGDNVILLDYHTTVSPPYMIPCYVQDIEGEYYVLRKRDFKKVEYRVGMYYPHVKAG